MDRRAFLRTMRILEARNPFRDWARDMDAFEVLVSTILSQSTTVANERRGLDGLRDRFGPPSPEGLAEAQVADIESAIWHSGLARQKAPRIKAVARIIAREWGGSMDKVLALPIAEARERLQSLPGVGPKTADVVLAMAAHRPVFPVDTHIARIAGRWNLTRGRTYEEARAALERWTPPAKRLRWHMAIIGHGRALCKARNPLCEACPVARDCDWYRARRSHPGKRALRRVARQKVKNR